MRELKNLKVDEEDWKIIMKLKIDLDKTHVADVIKMLLRFYYANQKNPKREKN